MKKNKTIGGSLRKMFTLKKTAAKKGQLNDDPGRPNSPAVSISVSR